MTGEPLNQESQCVKMLGSLSVSMLATGHKVCGFKPGQERWIFNGDKNQ
jgi:hypothetical protein